MRIHRQVVLVLAATAGLSAPASADELDPPIRYELSVEKRDFVPGEPIVVTFRWTNDGRRPVHMVRWKGPTDAVYPGEFELLAIDGDREQRQPYLGHMTEGGGRPPVELGPGETLEEAYCINCGIRPWITAYDLSTPGRYRVRSSYQHAYSTVRPPRFPHVSNTDPPGRALPAKAIELDIRPLDAEGLERNRAALRAGSRDAVPVAIAHHDVEIVSDLIAHCHRWPSDKLALRALSLLGTDDAVRYIGERAVAAASGVRDDPVLVSSFAAYLAAMESPVALPYMRRMLDFPGWNRYWARQLHTALGEPWPEGVSVE